MMFAWIWNSWTAGNLTEVNGQKYAVKTEKIYHSESVSRELAEEQFSASWTLKEWWEWKLCYNKSGEL